MKICENKSFLSFDFCGCRERFRLYVTEALKLLKGLISLICKDPSNGLLLCLPGDECQLCQLLFVAGVGFICQMLCNFQVLWGPWRMFPPVHPHPTLIAFAICTSPSLHTPRTSFWWTYVSWKLVTLALSYPRCGESCKWDAKALLGGMCHTDVFLHTFVITECCLLATMAFGHCMALLHYATQMSRGVFAHLAIVSWGIGCLVGLGQNYLRPKSNHSPGVDKLLVIFYTAVTSMLNSIIYSLRNQEVKEALRRTLGLKKVLIMNR